MHVAPEVYCISQSKMAIIGHQLQLITFSLLMLNIFQLWQVFRATTFRESFY